MLDTALNRKVKSTLDSFNRALKSENIPSLWFFSKMADLTTKMALYLRMVSSGRGLNPLCHLLRVDEWLDCRFDGPRYDR